MRQRLIMRLSPGLHWFGWNHQTSSYVLMETNYLSYLFLQRNDMLEDFGEQLQGFSFTVNGWVQSHGSHCVKPPIIYGDVSRPNQWSCFGQSMPRVWLPALWRDCLQVLWQFWIGPGVYDIHSPRVSEFQTQKILQTCIGKVLPHHVFAYSYPFSPLLLNFPK